jgi:hypothetical protein
MRARKRQAVIASEHQLAPNKGAYFAVGDQCRGTTVHCQHVAVKCYVKKCLVATPLIDMYRAQTPSGAQLLEHQSKLRHQDVGQRPR